MKWCFASLLNNCWNNKLHLLKMVHSTNFFTVNVTSGSKELMILDKLATANFQPDAQYIFELANPGVLVVAIDCNLKHYAYKLTVARVPTKNVIAADDPTNITYSVQVNVLKDWNKTNVDMIQKYATMIWGDCSQTITTDK